MSPSIERLTAALADRYRIEREVGHGGMATVYLAEDIKHKRKVALKVLKPELAAVLGAERFVQEITTTAALQHPHILPLFDSGTADGFLYYVMPFIDGETLRDKLDRETQLGIDEAVKIAIEVADALDYAHGQGVVHRDIKPENILLHNGRPMVADFGIALALSAAAGGRMTETGLSLGTPYYMSPEQATAEKEISARSDVYSLGSVLYEMLAGQPPHLGGSAQQIIMKIIAEPVPLVTTLRKSVPLNVAAATAKSLEKLPADRFASAKAFGEALTNPAFTTGASGLSSTTPIGAAGWRARAAVPLIGVTVALLGLALWGWLRPPANAGLFSRFSIPVQTGIGIGGVGISPDGSQIIYQDVSEGLLLRSRESLDAHPVKGIKGPAWSPFFSPDGRSIGYDTGFPGSLMVVSIDGGTPQVLVADSSAGYGGHWSADGTIYYTSARGSLMRVPAAGGTPRLVASPDTARGEYMLVGPDVLPNGRAALVVVYGAALPQIGVVDFTTGSTTILTQGMLARFAAPDHLLIARETGELVVLPFDPKRLAVTGPAVSLGDRARIAWGGYTAALALSQAGDLLYLSQTDQSATLVRVGRTGATEPVDPDWREMFSGMALSPDGKRLAISKYVEGRDETWVKTLDRGPLSRLAFGGNLSYRPTWSPDGRSITFLSDRDLAAPQGAYTVSADGGGEATLIYRAEAPVDEVEWSRDGKWLVMRTGSGGGRDLYAIRWGTDEPPIPIAVTQFDEYAPTLSPDGRFVAYVSAESGHPEVHVRPFPNVQDAKWPVSTHGGAEPAWAHSGRELFYRSAGNELVAVQVAPGPTFRSLGEQVLFSTIDFHADALHRMYEVMPGDQSFLFAKLRSGQQGAIVVVEHWLKALEPGGIR